MTLNNIRAAAIDRRRPKRQRTPTTMYTDDNPTTFTTKIFKGKVIYGPAPATPVSSSTSTPSSDPQPKKIKSSSLEESSSSTTMPPPPAKRGPGRPPSKRKSLEPSPPPPPPKPLNGGKQQQQQQQHFTPVVHPEPIRTVTSSSLDTAPATPTKRKRGRPPKNRPKEEDVIVETKSHNNNIISSTNAATMTTRKNHQQEHSFTNKNGQRKHYASVVDEKDDVKEKPSLNTSKRETSKISTSITSPPNGHHNKQPNLSSRKMTSRVNNTAASSTTTHPKYLRSSSWTPPQEDSVGTLLNHSVNLASILPPILIHDNQGNQMDSNNRNTKQSDATHDHEGHSNVVVVDDEKLVNDPHLQALKSKYPVVFESGAPKICTNRAAPFSSSSSTSGTSSSTNSKSQQSQQPHLPSWTPLYTPPVYFEDDYDRETGQLDVATTIPVTRQITALTVRKPHHDYLVLGDSAGFVLIYCLGKDNVNRPVARLESVACQQRAKIEQERLRADLKRKRAKNKSSASTAKGTSTANRMGLALFSSNNDRRKNMMRAAVGPQQAQSILMDTSETTIHALGMIGDRVVLATAVELECMDVPSATSLWVCPLSSNRFVTSLDMHLHTYDVLVSCSKETVINNSDSLGTPSVSSLMLLQHSKHNVEICDANSPMLVRSPSCTAIWDAGCDNRLLFVALSSNRQEMELVLVSGGSIDTWKVACKTKIPMKSSAASNVATTTTKLSQSPGGLYTLVASSRGIRLYQTETLQLIHVYGDQLALHGQSVMWKDCWLAGSYFLESKGISKARRSSSPWLECDDWLAQTMSTGSKKNSKNDTPDLPPYVIGVPNVKGPKELCESLHVWKVEHATVVPAMSVPLPRKGQGALGLVGGGSDSSNGENSLILVTNDGQGHAMLPKLESEFAGIMYPPGYEVITDNIEFIEEEDALDHVVEHEWDNASEDEGEDEDVDVFGSGVPEDDMDEELKEAMRQSLLEHKRQQEARMAMKHDMDVDILVSGTEEQENFLPCRPEPYLRQFVNTEVDDDDENVENAKEVNTTGKTDEETKNQVDDQKSLSTPAKSASVSGALFVSNVLETLPNMEKPKPMEEDCLSFTTTKVVVAMNPVVPARPGRGRKSRAGNLETMLKSSINPYLQSMMISRQGVAADGSGSRLEPIAKDGAKLVTPSPPSSSDNPVNQWNGSGVGLPQAGSSTTPEPKATTADEAAVALGLLGLSPSPTNAPTKNSTDVLSSVVPPKMQNITAGSGTAYLSASSLLSWAAKHNEKGETYGVSGKYHASSDSMAASSDRGSAIEESEGHSTTTDHGAYRQIPHVVDKTCNACRGRHVIHSCGKRALPIDYDEVAKAERERREKEEEEKKRLRAEKRRLADQRRREARKQKQRDLEQQRLREAEEERLEKERQMRLQEDFAAQDLNQRRREQVVASYAQFQEQGSMEMNSVNYGRPQTTVTIEQISQNVPASSGSQGRSSVAQMANNFEGLSQPQIGSIFEQASRLVQPAAPSSDTLFLNRPASAGEAAASYRRQVSRPAESENVVLTSSSVTASSNQPREPSLGRASVATTSQLASAAAPSVSARLGAADALAALATLADASAPVITRTTAPVSNPTGFTSYSFGQATQVPSSSNASTPSISATHGFGIPTSTPSYGEGKRVIPSYAVIRGQLNSDDTATINGSNQKPVNTYVWPPRRED